MVQEIAWWCALAVGVPLYWRAPVGLRPTVLAVVSMAFLLWVDVYAAPLVLLLTLFWRLARQEDAAARRRDMALAAVVALALLLTFKLVLLTASSPPVLPVGLSYLTFRFVHVALDVRRHGKFDVGLAEWMSYATFAPIASAGPIERLDHFRKNRAEEFAWSHIRDGAWRMMIGLVKKAILVELLIAPMLPSASGLDDFGFIRAWQFAALNMLYAYLDFSAYSDLAIGAARLFGVRVVENFDWPLLAGDLQSFWRRWHMSLLQWCQAYVYMPLIGITRNPYVASYATFFVMAMWHDISINWFLWGVVHATGIVVSQKFGTFRRARKIAFLDRAPWSWARPVLLFAFLCFPAALTGTNDHGPVAAATLIAKMLGLGGML